MKITYRGPYVHPRRLNAAVDLNNDIGSDAERTICDPVEVRHRVTPHGWVLAAPCNKIDKLEYLGVGLYCREVPRLEHHFQTVLLGSVGVMPPFFLNRECDVLIVEGVYGAFSGPSAIAAYREAQQRFELPLSEIYRALVLVGVFPHGEDNFPWFAGTIWRMIMDPNRVLDAPGDDMAEVSKSELVNATFRSLHCLEG